MSSEIEWTDELCHVVVGCSPVSLGCVNCWAARLASGRLRNRPRYKGLAYFGGWTGEVRCDRSELNKLLHWRKPRRIFVAPMGDLFHKTVPFGIIRELCAVMVHPVCRQHTFQILTKRPERAKLFVEYVRKRGDILLLTNVWWGVSCENQQTAAQRIPILLNSLPGPHWLSYEPALGPLDLREIPNTSSRKLAWVVIGCESGPRRRPMHLDWARRVIQQCDAGDVPVFVKQLPVDGRVSRDPEQWPADLRRREWPRTVGSE